MSARAAIARLGIQETVELPGGAVRRTSLFGYEVGGDVLSLEEAVERATAADAAPAVDEPRVDVVGLEVTVDDAPGPCGVTRPPDPFADEVEVEPLVLEVQVYEPGPERVVELDGACEDDSADAEDIEPTEAVARICLTCDGGRRRIRGGCYRCYGRGVRAWVDNREVVRAPPAGEAARLGLAYALAEFMAEAPETAQRGARDLLEVALAGVRPQVRALALAQWRLMVE